MEGEGCLKDGAKPRLDLVDVHMFETVVSEFDVKCHNFFYNCFLIVIMFRQLSIWVSPLWNLWNLINLHIGFTNFNIMTFT